MSLRRSDILLIVSISLNVFLIGAALTVYALRATGVPAAGGQRAFMRVAASSLDEVHKAAFMQLLHTKGQIIQAETRKARSIRDEAWASIAADSFNPTIVKRQLAQARELNVLAHRTVEDAVVDFSASLPPVQRESFSKAMRRAASHQHWDPVKERSSTP